MNEDFVSFSLAKKLKKKGFNKCVCGYYRETGGLSICNTTMNSNALENEFSAPTISQVLKWLREEKIFISIGLSMCGYHYDVQYNIKNNSDYPDLLKWNNAILNGEQTIFASYEEAAIAGIEYVIDNLI